MALVSYCHSPFLPCAIFVFVLVFPVVIPGTIIAPVAPIIVFIPFALPEVPSAAQIETYGLYEHADAKNPNDYFVYGHIVIS